MKINTTPGETYIVLSTGGCTVTTGAGKQIKKLAAGQDFFTAMTGDSIISDDNASVAVAKGEILSMLNTDGTGSDVQATLRFQPVTSQSAFPATGENGVIYLVPSGNTAPNQWTEWVWTGAAYEQLGDASVDLSGYVSKADLAGDNGEFMVGKNMLVANDYIEIGGELRTAGSVALSKCTLVGTLGDGSWKYDSLRVGDFGHPFAIYADGKAIGAMWAESSHVHALLDVETPVLKSPEGHMSVVGSLRLFSYENPDGSTAAPTLSAPFITCSRMSTNRILVTDGGIDVVGRGILVTDGGIDVVGQTSEIILSEMAKLDIRSGSTITGDGWDAIVADIQAGAAAAPTTLTEVSTLTFAQGATIKGIRTDITVVGTLELAGADKTGSSASLIMMESGTGIVGPGWDEIVSGIQAGAAAAAVAANDVPEEFTKLIFPPTGTATAEQDPSWITKSHILMQTNGGQLNMTQLTATLAYAAQTPLAIAKRTLWLSTSSGTGDAVQWPANAVFPDDQSQDKIQQLNSNSTYWFDITYVGGSDTVLIRKVCSWTSTTGESGPTE